MSNLLSLLSSKKLISQNDFFFLILVRDFTFNQNTFSIVESVQFGLNQNLDKFDRDGLNSNLTSWPWLDSVKSDPTQI